MVEIALRLKGVDLEDQATGLIISEKFADMAWLDSDGLVTATLFAARNNVMTEVIEAARQIESSISGVKVVGVHRDLVGITDIAIRAGVSREGARKWCSTEGFPVPFDYIGSGSMKVWAWTEIVDWLGQSRGLELDDDLPSVELMTQIENCLMRNPDHTSVLWHQVGTKAHIFPPVFQSVSPAVRVLAGGRAQEGVNHSYTFVGAAARA